VQLLLSNAPFFSSWYLPDIAYVVGYHNTTVACCAAVWELLTARVAFKGLHYGAIIEHVALMGERPPMPEGTPEDFRLLMSSCWHADAQQRPAFDQVREQSAFNAVLIIYTLLFCDVRVADAQQRPAFDQVRACVRQLERSQSSRYSRQSR
jgi:hypothetical protein